MIWNNFKNALCWTVAIYFRAVYVRQILWRTRECRFLFTGNGMVRVSWPILLTILVFMASGQNFRRRCPIRSCEDLLLLESRFFLSFFLFLWTLSRRQFTQLANPGSFWSSSISVIVWYLMHIFWQFFIRDSLNIDVPR